jgi:hypothetical protein
VGYKIIALVVLFLLVVQWFHLGPAITRFANTIADVPGLDSRYSHDPAVYGVLVRAMYLIAIVGIVKLLLSKKKGDD